MNFKGLLSSSSDTCCWETAGGNDDTHDRNESDPHLNEHWVSGSWAIVTIVHLTARLISESITTNKTCSLIPHPKHWWPSQVYVNSLQKDFTRRLRQTIVVTRKRHANVTLQAVELFHHSILLFIIILYTTQVFASWACLYWLLVAPFAS